MQPERILVTGAGGFVGRHLLPALRLILPGAELFTQWVDVTDFQALAGVVSVAKPDVCVHLAAVAAIPAARQNPDHAWTVNLHGTLNLANAIKLHAPACVLVFISSADGYGASFRAGTPLNEEAPLAPLNVYGATKAAADLALGAMAQDGLHAIRLRPFNHTGPGQSDEFMVAAFARQIARIRLGLQEPVLNVGALDPYRDILDVRDVCTAYAISVAQAKSIAPGTILNLASGTPRRVGSVLQQLLLVAGVDAEIKTDPARLRPSDIPMACGDAAKARGQLGWAPAIPWEKTLQDVVEDWLVRMRV